MNEIVEKVQPLLETYLEKIGGMAVEDAKKYGVDMAEDFSKYMYRSLTSNDQEAERNLDHLEAQGELLLVKHRIPMEREGRKFLLDALKIAAQIGLAMLKINLPIA